MFPSRPSQSEREQLGRWLYQQAPIAPGPKSAETVQRFINDTDGMNHDVGGEFHDVVVGPDNIPRVINEQRAKVLDCGHIVTSLSEILGMCDFGHILCYREKLYKCSECKRILCIDDVEEKDGNIICPACKNMHHIEQVVIVIGILLAFVGLLLIFKR